MAAVDSKMESVVGVSTVSVPAVEEVAVVPVLAVALMADGQQVQEGLFLQLVAPKLQMLRVLVLAADEANRSQGRDPPSWES